MSSFGCPHLNINHNRCTRVCDECVPGRPGCVLAGKFRFAVPVAKRLRDKKTACGSLKQPKPGNSPEK